MNDPGAGSESRRVAGHPVVEAESDADDEVGVLDRAVDVHFSVHARHAQMQVMTLGKCADAEQGSDHGDVGLLGEGKHRLIGTGEYHAVSYHEQRTLRFTN